MGDLKILEQIMEELLQKGADKVSIYGSEDDSEELHFEHNEINLLRGFTDRSINIMVIKDHKKATTSFNQITEADIKKAVDTVINDAENSQPDEAYDICDLKVKEKFCRGNNIRHADRDKMYDRIEEYIDECRQKYPAVSLEGSIIHYFSKGRYINSHGVDLFETDSGYSYWTMFSACQGSKVSSFNHTSSLYNDLQTKFLDSGLTRELIEQSVSSLDSKPVPGTFEGDIVLAPGLVNEFMGYLVYSQITDNPIITGDSILKGKINEKVLHESVTLYSDPVNPDLAGGSFINKDGFVAEKMPVFEQGVLKNYMLSLFGANKTGLSLCKSGGCFVMNAGNDTVNEVIKNVKKGLYVVRFSGGHPSANGDFSGIAKNSYYIEDGEIKYPVNETMISGNLLQLFANVKNISSRRINNGQYLMPWVSCSGVNISR